MAKLQVRKVPRLNPYSIGIWSATQTLRANARKVKSLNPYSIGIWSATLEGEDKFFRVPVLILILLEYGLRQVWRSDFHPT